MWPTYICVPFLADNQKQIKVENTTSKHENLGKYDTSISVKLKSYR
jgi:hypothetical protein